MVFEKLKSANLSMKKSKCSFFSKEIQYLGHILSATWYQTITCQNTCHTTHATTNDTQTSQSLPWFGRILYRKFIKGFAKIAKPLTLLTRQQVKFDWTPEHHTAFLHLKEAIVQAPILHYPNPDKRYIVYTDTSDDTCRAQLVTRTQWYRVPSSISITHFHRNSTEMEHY